MGILRKDYHLQMGEKSYFFQSHYSSSSYCISLGPQGITCANEMKTGRSCTFKGLENANEIF